LIYRRNEEQSKWYLSTRLGTLETGANEILDLSVSYDGTLFSLVATGNNPATSGAFVGIYVLANNTISQLGRVEQFSFSNSTTVLLSGDGTRLFITERNEFFGGGEEFFRVVRINRVTGQLSSTQVFYRTPGSSLLVNYNGTLLATVSPEPPVYVDELSDVRGIHPIFSFRGRNLKRMALSKDGDYIVFVTERRDDSRMVAAVYAHEGHKFVKFRDFSLHANSDQELLGLEIGNNRDIYVSTSTSIWKYSVKPCITDER